jgi:hypothetical protein
MKNGQCRFDQKGVKKKMVLFPPHLQDQIFSLYPEQTLKTGKETFRTCNQLPQRIKKINNFLFKNSIYYGSRNLFSQGIFKGFGIFQNTLLECKKKSQG